MATTITGRVHLVEDTKEFGSNGFRKRVVVLEISKPGGYTDYVPLEFIKDGCDRANALTEGDMVEVEYRLGGRRWQKDPTAEPKYFLSATAFSFRKLDARDEPVEFASNNPAPADVGTDIPF